MHGATGTSEMAKAAPKVSDIFPINGRKFLTSTGTVDKFTQRILWRHHLLTPGGYSGLTIAKNYRCHLLM
jgi:hypothetical protein